MPGDAHETRDSIPTPPGDHPSGSAGSEASYPSKSENPDRPRTGDEGIVTGAVRLVARCNWDVKETMGRRREIESVSPCIASVTQYETGVIRMPASTPAWSLLWLAAGQEIWGRRCKRRSSSLLAGSAPAGKLSFTTLVRSV